MRPIKFRVWDKSLEEMRYSINIPSDYTERNGSLDLINMFQTLNQRYVFMQYTGLKDKNGTPIYEGDIVTGQSFESSMLKHWKSGILKHLDYEVEYVPEMYVIKYHEASFKTFDLKGKWVAVLNHHVSSMVEDLQVVGNIFQDGDLLRDS